MGAVALRTTASDHEPRHDNQISGQRVSGSPARTCAPAGERIRFEAWEVVRLPDPETTVRETERLILRRLTMEDLDALAAIYRDPEVRRYFPEGTLTHEKTREELEWIINVY